MSVLANPTPTMFDSTQNLLIKICEALQTKFPMAANLIANPTDSINTLLYKIAYNLNNIPSTGGSGNYSGTGSPEGVQTATVGSTYLDITDPNHPIEYVKTSGSGNTGWVLFVAS
jgi:hypothetical protein